MFRRAALARYVGQSSEIEVRLPDGGEFLADFAELFGAEHERNYGFRAPPEEPVELMGLSVIARGVPARPRLPDAIPPATSRCARKLGARGFPTRGGPKRRWWIARDLPGGRARVR